MEEEPSSDGVTVNFTGGIYSLLQCSMKKCSEVTQTLCAVCSKAKQKKFAPPHTPSWGRGIEKNNQLEMVTTFTLQSQFGDDGARNFQLSW